MRCGEPGKPPPRESIAVHDDDGREQAPNRGSKKMEESLLRRFGHFLVGDPRTSPWCGANPRRGNRLSRSPSPAGTAIDAFSHPTDGPKQRRKVSSVVLDALDSGIAGFLRAVLRKGEVADRLPGCPSPVGTAMDGFTAPESGAELQGRVYPAVVCPFWASIVSFLRAGSRNARGGHLSPHPPPGETAMNGRGDLKNGSKPPRKVS